MVFDQFVIGRPTPKNMVCWIFLVVVAIWPMIRLSNIVVKRTSKTTPETHTIMYHKLRTDRSGSVIHDMLVAHAFAFSQNWTYGGACCCNKKKSKGKQQAHVNQTRDLLEQLLGPQYDLFLPLACPPSKKEQQAAAAAASSTHIVKAGRDRKLYRDPVEPNRAVFTAAWKRHLFMKPS